MKFAIFFLLSFVLIPASAETLHYSISWPSGLSLGEATVSVSDSVEKANPATGKAASESLSSDFDVDASVPGFAIGDHYHSTAGTGLCSSKLEKTAHRGSRKTEETVTFHQSDHTVTRQTKGDARGDGGKSDLSVSTCARDALTFLQFARNELSQGRLAPQESVVLGALYTVRLEAQGATTVKVGGKPVETDRVQATIKGPASNYTVQIFFARDPARTPVLIQIPLSLGTFAAELTH
jgi:hypothetical protein